MPASRPPAVTENLLGTGTIMIARGQEVEFFTIGRLAAALNRRAVTLRAWEAAGILPTSGYHTPSRDPRGRRRLYTRAQCEAIIRLAKELGVMEASSRRPLGEFGRRVASEFLSMKGGK